MKRPLKVRESIRIKFLGLLTGKWEREYEVPNHEPVKVIEEEPQKKLSQR